MWITGRVIDDSGRGLRGVVINARRGASSRDVVTNPNGHYVVQDLRPGAYTLTFACAGYSTVERKTDALTTFVATINGRLHAQG